MAQPKARAHHLTVIGSNSQRPSYHKKLSVNLFRKWMTAMDKQLGKTLSLACDMAQETIIACHVSQARQKALAEAVERAKMQEHQLDSLQMTAAAIAALSGLGLVCMIACWPWI